MYKIMSIFWGVCAVLIGLQCIGCVVYLAMRLVRACLKRKRAGQSVICRPIITAGRIAVAVIILSGLSWVINMGWFRVIMLWFFPLMLILVGYAVIYYRLMRKSAPYMPQLRWNILCTSVLFFTSIAFFPDGGDGGTAYMFFLLIHHRNAVTIGFTVCGIALVGCILSMILQYRKFRRLSAPADPAGEDPAGKNG